MGGAGRFVPSEEDGHERPKRGTRRHQHTSVASLHGCACEQAGVCVACCLNVLWKSVPGTQRAAKQPPAATWAEPVAQDVPPADQEADAEAEEADPPADEAEGAEEPPRTEANHWGWKTWSDTITDGDNHTTHAAICGPDGLVWTSSATSDAWRAQFPLSERSADARKLVRKMEMEAYFRGGEQKVRRMAAAQRLAWSTLNVAPATGAPVSATPGFLCRSAVLHSKNHTFGAMLDRIWSRQP